VFAHLLESILFRPIKEKSLFSWLAEKKSNNMAIMQEMAGSAGRYGRRKVTW
jgi:hypothetical protein